MELIGLLSAAEAVLGPPEANFNIASADKGIDTADVVALCDGGAGCCCCNSITSAGVDELGVMPALAPPPPPMCGFA